MLVFLLLLLYPGVVLLCLGEVQWATNDKLCPGTTDIRSVSAAQAPCKPIFGLISWRSIGIRSSKISTVVCFVPGPAFCKGFQPLEHSALIATACFFQPGRILSSIHVPVMDHLFHSNLSPSSI